jgi:hypothetical protein
MRTTKITRWQIATTRHERQDRIMGVRMARMLRGGARDDGSFDIAFWQKVGPEGIFAAAWEMVSEVRRIRGEDGDEPRLQRSVVRVIRRAR